MPVLTLLFWVPDVWVGVVFSSILRKRVSIESSGSSFSFDSSFGSSPDSSDVSVSSSPLFSPPPVSVFVSGLGLGIASSFIVYFSLFEKKYDFLLWSYQKYLLYEFLAKLD